MRGNRDHLSKIISLFKKNIYPLTLVVVVLAVLYPFTGMMNFPKWDTTNGYLPYRYFISFFLENDQMPYWNPFQRMGYPGYADLQSGCWYPITRIIMLFGQYDIISMNIELLSCFVIAALGMYRFSMSIHHNEKTAFLLGLAYSLSGFMTGSTHLMVFLIGVAWLPWIIWSLREYLKTMQMKYAVYLCGFMAMNITGASPAYTIIMLYIIIVLILWHWMRMKFSGTILWSILRQSWPAVIIFLVIMAPYVASFYEFLPYFNRAQQRPYEDMVINPLVPGNWLSLVFPYATNDRNHDWFKLTDLSLRNTYIGFAMLIMVLLGCIRYFRNKIFIAFLISAILSFWIACGDETFLYQYLFKLPGFGTFRHPAFFRSYGIFCLIVLAGFRLKDLFEGKAFIRSEKILLGVSLSLLVMITAISAGHSSLELLKKAWHEVQIMEELPSTGLSTLTWLNGMVTIALLWIAVLLKKVAPLSWFTTIAFFTIADLGLQSRFTGPTTMYHTYDFTKMKSFFDELPHDIAQIPTDIPMREMHDKRDVKLTDGIQVNYATFFKHVCSEGENPLRMKDFDDAKKSGALDWNLNYPLIFMTDQFWQEGKKYVGYEASDTNATIRNSQEIKAMNIGFNSFTADFSNPSGHESWLCLNQNYHGQWSAQIQGNPVPIEKVNGMIMAVKVPANSSGTVVFTYASKWLPILQWLAVVGWMVWFFWLVFPEKIRFSVMKK